MGLVSKFNMNNISAALKKAEQDYIFKLIRVLRFVGEKAVNEARANGTYQDRTANLRNSIGYVIVVNGEIVGEDFNASKAGKEPSEEDPIKYGKDLAYEIAASHSEIALIVVAGMRYGAYVEATGRNVLTSAEQLANVQLPNLLNQLK